MSSLFGKHTQRKRARPAKDDADATANGENAGIPPKHEQDSSLSAAAENEETPDSSSQYNMITSFDDLGLAPPLLKTCRSLGFKKPTPVQRVIIPFLLREERAHVLALAATGSGKTAAFVLPMLHRLALDPYGIYCVILTPTRELAKQIHQQVLAFGSAYHVQSALVVGGLDAVRQSTELDQRPHVCVATPGRLAELLRGPNPPRLKQVRYLVLDEADRLLASNSGFERDVAELLLHCTTSASKTNNDAAVPKQRRNNCQTLLFSATMTRSLESIEELAGAGMGRLPLRKFVLQNDSGATITKKAKKQKAVSPSEDASDTNTKQSSKDVDEDATRDDDDSETEALAPRIPEGLKQEYIFMPSRVRDAYLLTAIRKLMVNGGRVKEEDPQQSRRNDKHGRHKFSNKQHNNKSKKNMDRNENDDEEENAFPKARLAIVFVSTCERAAMISCILDEVGVANVALHSLLSQNRRLAALGKFKSEQVRVLVATDVASRGLDIPTVDLVLNSELPRNPTNYVHRVGRTARAGRRGWAISLVGESDVSLVHAAERASGRPLEKCTVVTDDEAIQMLGPVTKAARLAKMKLMDIGFDELVQKFKERKVRDRKERQRIERALLKHELKQNETSK